MRIALLAPLPPAQSGIADYAAAWCAAMAQEGITIVSPPTVAGEGWPAAADGFWDTVDLVHAELGGGRAREFLMLEQLQRQRPALPLTATVHDPERLVWRDPSPAGASAGAPWPLPQVLALARNPATLARERRLAAGMARLVTLTTTGGQCLRQRMRLRDGQLQVIAHGNQAVAAAPLPENGPLKLLYFGFLYPGKGIEDLLRALADVVRERPQAALQLTLAGGSAPELTFGARGNYVDQLRAQARDLGIESQLHWQLDLPRAQIVPCVQAHHALVLPYRESWRIGLLGRMRGTSGALSWANACGRGVISSDARAFAEEVSHGNGVVFAQGDHAQLAQRIASVLDDRWQLDGWAHAAAMLGRQRQWPNVARQFATMFAAVREGACARAG